MSTNQHLDDGIYVEDFLENHQLEAYASAPEYEEERWNIVESEGSEFIALVDEEEVFDMLVYEDEEELEQALVEGDESRGRYAAIELDEGAMIYDREDGAAFIKSTAPISLENIC